MIVPRSLSTSAIVTKPLIRAIAMLACGKIAYSQTPLAPPSQVGQWAGPFFLRLYPAHAVGDPLNLGKEPKNDSILGQITIDHDEVGAAAVIPPTGNNPYAGQILAWNFELLESGGNEVHNFRAWIIDPTQSPPSVTPLYFNFAGPNNLSEGTSFFCSGFSWSKDGKLTIAGGGLPSKPNGQIYEFDPTAAQPEPNPSGFTKQFPPMSNHLFWRFYPSMITMGSGANILIGGYQIDSTTNITNTSDSLCVASSATLPISYAAEQTFAGTSTNNHFWGQYPRAFCTKSGKIFVAFDNFADGSTPSISSTWEYQLGNSGSLVNLVTHAQDHWYGSAVIIEEQVINPAVNDFYERIFTIGGSPWLANPPASGNPTTLQTIHEYQLVNGTPTWTSKGVGAFGRMMANAVILPNRTVFLVGGSSLDSALGVVYAQPVQIPEIFDPSDQPAVSPFTPLPGTWTQMANHTEHRMDHSTAVLLPDGRVFAIGGLDNTSPTPVTPGTENVLRPGDTAEIFSPPYLFKGPRPVISSISASTWNYGDTNISITVRSGSNLIALPPKVVLMRPCACTHNFDFDQRYVEVKSTSVTSAGSNIYNVSVSAPPAGTNGILKNAAPPGWYMLFVIDQTAGPGNEIPSVAKWVKLQ
ncbi:MAG: DUF1929 domain-containing protein [Planctomycetes bacterium]|nr:DUF1929 domain-containing protein [Planctomycetota bacterium]